MRSNFLYFLLLLLVILTALLNYLAFTVQQQLPTTRSQYLELIRTGSYSIVKNQEWGDKTWNEEGEYGILRRHKKTNLVYIYNPKTGSDTIRFAMRGEVERSHKSSQGIILNKTELQKCSDAFIFTTVRNPEERIASAYSTMMHRLYERGWAHHNDLQLNITPWPQTSTDIQAWEDHFRQMVHVWMSTINRYGWDHPDLWWDQHLIPQYEYLKGYNISYICCTDRLDRCFSKIGLRPPKVVRNSYEKAAFMPEKKFQKFDLLKAETQMLVRKLYKDDYDIYDIFCGRDAVSISI
jgi:hypothetical protein